MSSRVMRAALISGVLILVAIGWLVARTLFAPPSPMPAFTVRLPSAGEVAGVRLRAGRPAFVVHHQNGEISLLDAFSTHAPYGVFKMLRWCSSSRMFEDPAHGARYDEWGRHSGGPAPTGMITYTWQRVGDRLVVGVEEGPVPGGDPQHPPPGDFADCAFLHDFSADRRFTPAEALAQPEGSWLVVAGVVDPQFQRLCALGTGCPAPAFIADLQLHQQLDERAVTYLRRPQLWLAKVTDGRLGHLAWIVDPPAD